MPTMLGMDTAQATNTARTFRTEATAIQTAVQRVDSALRGTTWVGNDQKKFIGEWEGSKGKLLQAKALLDATASALDKQRMQQEQTSAG